MKLAKWEKSTVKKLKNLCINDKLCEIDDEMLIIVIETVYNLLHNPTITVNHNKAKKLIPFVDKLRKLSKIRNLKLAKIKVNQIGSGVISILLPIIASALAQYVVS